MTTSPRAQLLAEQFAFTSHLLDAVLEDLSNEHAGHRTRGGQGSSASFIVGHLLASRAQVLAGLGEQLEDPWQETFGGDAPAREVSAYSSIAELRAAWNEQSAHLATSLAAIDEARADSPGPEWLPVADKTVIGLLQFFAWHEAYHVGQVGLLRTEQGLPSIRSLVQAAESAAR